MEQTAEWECDKPDREFPGVDLERAPLDSGEFPVRHQPHTASGETNLQVMEAAIVPIEISVSGRSADDTHTRF